jgi:hypothetical protein
MTRSIAAICCALLLLATGAQSAAARPETTAPGVVYTIKVVITDSSILFAKDKFSRNGVPAYPRGGVIHYEILNNGKRPYALKVWDEVTSPIPPRGHGSMLVNWNFRGLFGYATLYHGKPAGPRGRIVIF